VIAGEQIPLVIDELPMLAALGHTRRGIEIRDAAELRVKESDGLRHSPKIYGAWTPKWRASRTA